MGIFRSSSSRICWPDRWISGTKSSITGGHASPAISPETRRPASRPTPRPGWPRSSRPVPSSPDTAQRSSPSLTAGCAYSTSRRSSALSNSSPRQTSNGCWNSGPALRSVDDAALRDMPALDRLQYHLIRAGMHGDFLEVLRYSRRGDASAAPLVRRGSRSGSRRSAGARAGSGSRDTPMSNGWTPPGGRTRASTCCYVTGRSGARCGSRSSASSGPTSPPGQGRQPPATTGPVSRWTSTRRGFPTSTRGVRRAGSCGSGSAAPGSAARGR